MGYKLDVEYQRPCSPSEEDHLCAPGIDQPYGNAAANEAVLEKMRASPVDVSVVADDGTFALDVGALSQAVMCNNTARFPNFASIGGTALEQAAGHPIHRLRVMIHGLPGRMLFGDQTIDYLYEAQIVAGFGPLKGHFAPDGFIELHSCHLADYPDDPTTDALISQIALAAGVPVVAAQSAQSAATPGMDGSTTTWTPQADGTTTQGESSDPTWDAIMGGLESFTDWLYGQAMR